MIEKIKNKINELLELVNKNSEQIKWLAYFEFVLFFSILWLWHHLNWQFFYQSDKLQHIEYSFFITIFLYLILSSFFKIHMMILDWKTKIDSKKMIIMVSVLIIWFIKEFVDIIVWSTAEINTWNNAEIMDIMFNFTWVAIWFIVIDLVLKVIDKNKQFIIQTVNGLKTQDEWKTKKEEK